MRHIEVGNSSFVEERVVNPNKNNNTNLRTIKSYKHGDKINTYVDYKDEKVATLGQKKPLIFEQEIFNYMQTDNFWQLLTNSIKTDIKKVTLNGKECYKIEGFTSPNILYSEHSENTMYFDKETGLLVRSFEDGKLGDENEEISMVRDYFYEFDTVGSSVFEEPNIKDYSVQKEK